MFTYKMLKHFYSFHLPPSFHLVSDVKKEKNVQVKILFLLLRKWLGTEMKRKVNDKRIKSGIG